eukprot:1118863_1
MGNQSVSSTNKRSDAFIINFTKKYWISHSYDAASICVKRVVFISMVGLFQTYKKCPPHVLYASLLILPIKKEWIYADDPTQFAAQLQSVSSGLIRDDVNSKEFIELIKWKESQGLVLYAKDECKSSGDDSVVGMDEELIHPFWRYVSAKLRLLHDPITSQRYKPLPFESSYWTNQIGITSENTRTSFTYEL